MIWEKGRTEIEGMLREGYLEKVPPSRDMADRLIAQARAHLASARTLAHEDPDGAYVLMYDGARKALAGILENQGLRATRKGGHLAVYDAAMAQLDPPRGPVLKPFQRMRRRRHGAEYPSRENEPIAPEDVLEDHPRAVAVVDTASAVLDHMPSF